MIAAAAVLATVIAEALAFAVLAILFAAVEGPEADAIRALTVVAVCVVAFALPYMVQWLGLAGRRALLFGAVVGFVAFYGALRIEIAGDLRLWDFRWALDWINDEPAAREGSGHALAVTMILAGAWIRAAVRASQEVEYEFVPRSLAPAFALVTAFVVLGAAGERAGDVAQVALAFYAMGIIALAASQLSLSGASLGNLRSGGITGALLGGTAAVVLVAVVIFGLLFGLLAPIIGPPLGRGIELVLTIILYPPAWLLEKLFRALLGDANPFNELTQLARPPTLTPDANEPSDPSLGERAGRFTFRSVALLAVVAIGVGLAVLVSTLRRRSPERHPPAHGTSAAGSAIEDLRGALGALFHRRGRGMDVSRGEGVVRLYREVLERSAEAARPRAEGETPSEFAPVLAQAFRNRVTDDITAAFEEARYAGRPPEPRRLAELEERWRAIDRLPRR